ncbi:MAG: glutamine synthetase [Rhizobiales bacterium]|nr:glutamine synthetase [Hyphomicrobiales bacterium]
MAGALSFEDLKEAVAVGDIDTVLVVQVDMQGRLMGKRFHANYFVDSAHKETHGCNYLLATDLEMSTIDGYKATNWSAGYGDYTMRPDLSTLRRIPWLDGTALVFCDVLDHHGHDVPHAPRAMLKRQIARLESMGFRAFTASELEFFLFQQSYEQLQTDGHRSARPIGAYNEDYHIFQTTKEEDVMRALRNGLEGADVPVESSKGEADAGQEEINVRYAEALTMADRHALVKNAAKEIAWSKGRSLTFMAKYKTTAIGNSCHIHQSLTDLDGKPVFFDPAAEHGMSATMRHYMAGLLEHATEITYFLAPYVNSYKRFAKGTFAPTKAVWSMDNRTAGFRVCGADTRSVRVECRIGGADLTPHLAMAALLAAGMDGIERRLALEPVFVGDAYKAEGIREIPRTLRAARDALDSSQWLRRAFGDDVVDHYVFAATWEQSEADRVVTDWDLARGFERA